MLLAAQTALEFIKNQPNYVKLKQELARGLSAHLAKNLPYLALLS